jgi:hypothetical protein
MGIPKLSLLKKVACDFISRDSAQGTFWLTLNRLIFVAGGEQRRTLALDLAWPSNPRVLPSHLQIAVITAETNVGPMAVRHLDRLVLGEG